MRIVLLMALVVLTSCGEDFYGKNRALTPPQQEQQIAPAPEEFRTRLNNNLLVEGARCRGNETTEPGGHGSLCSAGQYLIFIDTVNTC
nr:hypothetical protein [Bdellovibrionales bacterium]